MDVDHLGRHSHGCDVLGNIANHGRSGADSCTGADPNSWRHYAPNTHQSSFADSDAAGQMNAGGKMHIVFDDAIVVDGGRMIDDRVIAHNGIDLHNGLGQDHHAGSEAHRKGRQEPGDESR